MVTHSSHPRGSSNLAIWYSLLWVHKLWFWKVPLSSSRALPWPKGPSWAAVCSRSNFFLSDLSMLSLLGLLCIWRALPPEAEMRILSTVKDKTFCAPLDCSTKWQPNNLFTQWAVVTRGMNQQLLLLTLHQTHTSLFELQSSLLSSTPVTTHSCYPRRSPCTAP